MKTIEEAISYLKTGEPKFDRVERVELSYLGQLLMKTYKDYLEDIKKVKEENDI